MCEKFTASNGVWLVQDRGGKMHTGYGNVSFSPIHASQVEALREFFAQGELGKPWHDAEPGELWNVKVKDWDVDRCFVFAPFEGPFRFQTETETHIPVTDERIVFAVRVYPEEES